MIRISKMTDYATVILAALAREPAGSLLSTAELAGSTRGLRGGYALARPAAGISAAAILDALEGPVAVTDCSAGQGHCDIETTCGVGRAWQRVNLALRHSLHGVSLAQLAGLDAAELRLAPLERELRPVIGGRAAAALTR